MSDPSESTAKCAKCGKLRPQSSASITQWLFRQDNCDCDILDVPNGEAETEISQLCQTCGKPLLIGRTGSMTQWIFRTESCSCGSPVVIAAASAARAAAAAAAENQILQTERATLVRELANPLEVDPGKFPTDRYVPLAILGEGQHGTVYKAHDRLLKRNVAIKTVRGARLTSEQLIQFQSEAKATSQLNHENIISLFDFGVTTEGVPFLVMEYFHGETLQQLIHSNGPLPVPSGINVLVQACAGLQHAHEKRILHRDLKSSNILIGSKDGRIFLKIVDFGLSSLLSADDDSNTRGLRGTPTNMSPEQVRQQPVDERSDMYSLGCVAYEMFSGRVPFKEENALATMMKHVESAPEALSVANPEMEFNEDLELIVAKTLEKNPDDRYKDMVELKKALKTVRVQEGNLSGAAEPEPVISIPTRATLGEQTYKKAASRKSLLLILVLICTTAVAGLILVLGGIAPDSKEYNIGHSHDHPFLALDNSERTSNHNGSDHNAENAGQSARQGVNLVGDASELSGKEEKKRSEEQSIGTATNEIEFLPSNRGPGSYGNPDANDESLAQLQDLSKYPDMTILNLRDSDVRGDGLKYLLKRPLKGLVFTETPVTELALKYIGQMHNLKELVVNHTRIPVSAYSHLSSTNIEHLDANDSKLTDDAVESISRMRALKWLSIGDNKDLTDKSMGYISRIKNLETLHISKTGITGSAFRELSGLKKLNMLWADQCLIFDDDLDSIMKLPLLSIIFDGTHLTDRGLAKIVHLKSGHIEISNSGNFSAKAKINAARNVPNGIDFR
jgi:Serine/threonine protein kinase